MFEGLIVTDVSIQPDPDLSNCEFFKIGSPVFIQRRLEDGSNKHYTYEDTVAGNLLEETLRHKMQVAGLPDDRTLKISFATEYPKKKKINEITNFLFLSSECYKRSNPHIARQPSIPLRAQRLQG